jgi:hypothetical protein
LKRNNVTGKGIAMLEKIAYLFDEGCDEDNERVGFIQVRLAAPRSRKVPVRKPPKKRTATRTCTTTLARLTFRRDFGNRVLLNGKKWKKFNACVLLTKTKLQEVLDAGVEVNPMQWIETDKNAHKRRDDNNFPPELKSRVVGCGTFEEVEGLRTDSPTGELTTWCFRGAPRTR